jgi:hypothetical protein
MTMEKIEEMKRDQILADEAAAKKKKYEDEQAELRIKERGGEVTELKAEVSPEEPVASEPDTKEEVKVEEPVTSPAE